MMCITICASLCLYLYGLRHAKSEAESQQKAEVARDRNTKTQLYVIRILAAAMEKTARGGCSGGGGPGESDHAGVMLFVLKV